MIRAAVSLVLGANLLTSHLVLELKMYCLVSTALFTASLQLYQMQNKGETEMYPVPSLHASRGPWVQAKSHRPVARTHSDRKGSALYIPAANVESLLYTVFHLLGIN